MKGFDFVKKRSCGKSNFFNHGILLRTAGVLLMLTLFSSWLICGMLARFTSHEYGSALAEVAQFGGVTLSEHKAEELTDLKQAVALNTLYTLSSDAVSSNTYKAIPGAVIPKDPFIELDGSNGTACALYIEITDDSEGYAEYTLSDDWTEDGDYSPSHGGTVYKYKSDISANEKLTIKNILKNNQIRIKDSYEDLKGADSPDSFSVNFYAYLIQID